MSVLWRCIIFNLHKEATAANTLILSIVRIQPYGDHCRSPAKSHVSSLLGMYTFGCATNIHLIIYAGCLSHTIDKGNTLMLCVYSPTPHPRTVWYGCICVSAALKSPHTFYAFEVWLCFVDIFPVPEIIKEQCWVLFKNVYIVCWRYCWRIRSGVR